MGVVSDGSYGVPEGIVYSFPVRIKNKSWEIVQVAHCFVSATSNELEFSAPNLN